MVSNQEKVMIIRKKKCCKPRKIKASQILRLNARVIATPVYYAKYEAFWESKCNYKIEVTGEIGYTLNADRWKSEAF